MLAAALFHYRRTTKLFTGYPLLVIGFTALSHGFKNMPLIN